MHRDIKPENIMIRRDGYVKVLDFGIAKLTEEYVTDSEAPTRRQVETAEGTVVGTAPYMSPEQVRGLAVDGRTDLWSLGVALYETVTGRKPFFGDTTQDVLAAVLQKEPPPLSRYAHEVPEELEWIVSKALRKERGARYQTATELLIDLKELKKKVELATSLAREPTGGALQSTRGRTAEVAVPAQSSSAEYIVAEIKRHKLAVIIWLLVLAAAIVGLGVFLHARNTEVAIDSIAVLPFVNQSQNPDTEYLSDGLSESIINSLTELKDLRVIPRSSSFRYKGKESDPLAAGHDLGVRAVLTGRVTQRGDSLIVSAELVDVRDNKEVWGQQYNRKLADLLPLQTELARDVSQKLRARLSGSDGQKLTKTYTANAEAYQLYLKGRYHVLKLTLSEIQTGISYFQQAIAIDPSYALAYVGLADAYRSALAGDMPPTELLPKAKEAAQKAIEIDDTLADAHAELGFIIFWYDWDWTAAENQYKRALELDPNGADTHLFYAHLLSNTGRHAEALAEVKRARELDPLNLRTNALEGQFLIHAGRADEALARLQKTFEMAPNYYFAHFFAASAYIEKGMFPEAIAEAQKARELSGPTNSHPMGFLGYALAKSGKQAEARALLEELLKRSTERYVSPYNIALIYNGLGERDNTFAWLERGYEKRDQRMVFLKVEPKWNNLRADPRFQDLLGRVGLSR